MSIDEILEKLFTLYNVHSNLDLSEKMGVSQQTITNWESKNSINAIKKKCRELGINTK